METVFGDGSHQQSGGVMGALLGAGKRLITGESLFMTVFTNAGGSGKQQVSFAAPYPGKILAMDLKQLGGQLICQKDSFLCAARGVSIGIAFQRRSVSGCSAVKDSSCRSSKATACCFVHAGGTVHPLDLGAGTDAASRHRLPRRAAAIAWATTSSTSARSRRRCSAAKDCSYAALTGPGRVWLQSLPFSRMADRIYKAAPAAGGSRREGGSILGGLGDLLDGDPNWQVLGDSSGTRAVSQSPAGACANRGNR